MLEELSLCLTILVINEVNQASTNRAYCTFQGQILVIFEYFEETFESYFSTRESNSQKSVLIPLIFKVISEDSIWRVIKSLAKCLKVYEDCQGYHGDIQPKHIVYCHDRSLKLLDPYVINPIPGFRVRLNDPTYFTPISPQALRSEKKGNLCSFSRTKNDIWGLGLSILSILIQEDFTIFYDWRSKSINYNLIDERLGYLQNTLGYSKDFIELMSVMLEEAEADRIGPSQLYTLLGEKGTFSQLSTSLKGRSTCTPSKDTVDTFGIDFASQNKISARRSMRTTLQFDPSLRTSNRINQYSIERSPSFRQGY